jgi:hypothetical protein
MRRCRVQREIHDLLKLSALIAPAGQPPIHQQPTMLGNPFALVFISANQRQPLLRGLQSRSNGALWATEKVCRNLCNEDDETRDGVK